MRSVKYAILIITAATLVAGCTKNVQKQNAQAQLGPKIVSVPEFAVSSVNSVGGEAAWNKTQAITGDCVIRVYNAGQAVYFTQQRHAVYPWSDTIRIVGTEPRARYVWQLSGNEYKLLDGVYSQVQTLPAVLRDKSTAQAIWNMLATPAGLATASGPTTRRGEPLRIDGIWYFPIALANGQVYLENRSSHMIDACIIPQTDGNGWLLVRGYSYQMIPDTLISVPRKFEIFSADKSGTPSQRIAEFDYSVEKSFPF